MTTFFTNLFCGTLITFCSVLIKNGFHGEVGNFGGAMVAFGTGGLIGAGISFITFPKWFKRNRFASGTAIFLGILVIAVALTHSFYFLIVLLILAGAALTISNISVNTFLQENSTNLIRGRIASLYQLAMFGGLSIGALVTGFTVSQFSISTAFVINGTCAVLFQSWLLWRQIKFPFSYIKIG